MAEADEKSTQVIKLKKRISEELNGIDKDIKDMEKSKKDSVEKIEIKKVELKQFSNTQAVCDEHYATLQEIEQASKLIEERKISITALDTTIANLDLQISKIQSEHDKAVAELEKKRRRLNDYLKYYEDLNDKLEKLIELLGEEEKKHCLELNVLKVERAKTLDRTDLSEDALNRLLGELDNKMVDLNKEHGKLIESISQKLSEITVDASGVEELLSEGKKKPEKKKPKAAVEDDTGGEGDTEPETEEEVSEEKVKDKVKAKEKAKVKAKKEGKLDLEGEPVTEVVVEEEEEGKPEVKKEVAPKEKKAKGVEGKKEEKPKDKHYEKKHEEREIDKEEDEEEEISTDELDKVEPKRRSMEKRKRPSLTRPAPKPSPEQKVEAAAAVHEEVSPPEVEVLKAVTVDMDEEQEQPLEAIDDSDYDYDSEDSADVPVIVKHKKHKRVVPDIPKKPKKKKKKKKKIAEEVEEEEERDSFDVDDEELFDWFRDKRMSKELRQDLLRQGMQITPSNRIITKDDRVLTLAQAQRLGLLDGFFGVQGDEEEEEEESSEEDEERLKGKKKKKYGKEVKYYQSPASSASTLGKESSESHICGRDVEYLKVVFGKSLTVALAEITAIQPVDPIHYLAHWMLKYRYNQEIDQITRIQIQELMIEQERLAAEKWHRELQEEARLAVLEALFRAENIIIQQDFQSELQLREYEGEFEESPPPIAV